MTVRRSHIAGPVLAAVTMTLAACGGTPHTAERPMASAAAVGDTAAVALVPWVERYEAGGIVRARQVATVASRMLATVSAVHVTEGSLVKRGQTLITLDDREVRAHATRAQAVVRAAERALDAARAELVAAEAAQLLARASHRRISSLAASQSATAQELDQATAALSAAEARVRSGMARVAEAEAGHDGAQAGLAASDVSVSYTTLRSPFDGLVTARLVDPGAMATPGAPLVTVDDVSSFTLDARVEATQLGRLRIGTPVAYRLDRGSDGAWREGTAVELGHIDPNAHTRTVSVSIDSEGVEAPGQFGRVGLPGTQRMVLAIPGTAVRYRGQVASVLVVSDDGRTAMRMVSLGDSRDGMVEVLAGLTDGERVVRRHDRDRPRVPDTESRP
jgi:multidrug efflux pump subunit AcrA (membrane-fusion protein)